MDLDSTRIDSKGGRERSEVAARRVQVIRPMALLMVTQVLDKGLYLVREGLVTARFGASALTDAFAVGLYVSNFILALLRPLIEDALIPVYVERLAADRLRVDPGSDADARSAQRLLEVVGLLILGLTGVSAALVSVFAPQIARFVAPGFSAEILVLTARVVRVMGLFTVVLGLTNFFLSALSAHRAYLVVGLSPLAATVVVILFLWLFAQKWGIHSLTWGMVAGTMLQLLVLAVALWRKGLLLPRGGYRTSGERSAHRLARIQNVQRTQNIRRRSDDGGGYRTSIGILARFTGLMMVVRFVAMGVGWLDRSLSSQLIEGSVASLAFAMNVYQLPLQVCVLAVTTVVIVQFSWHVARGDAEPLRRDLNLALRIAAFFLIPATVALIVLREPIVQVLYERGLFDAKDTAMTASVLAFYTVGLFPQAVAVIIVRLFLARKEAHWVLLIFGIGAVVHALFDLVLVGPLQQMGIALATTVGMIGMAVTSLWLARFKLGPLGGRLILLSLARSGLAAAGVGLGLYAALKVGAALPTLWVLAASTTVGLAMYGVLSYLIKTPELRILIASIAERVQETGVRG